MEIKPLEFKEFHHVSYSDIGEKYKDEFNSNSVRLSVVELKSMLALLFSIQFHEPTFSEQKSYKRKIILFEVAPVINITSKFGRHMIENLDKENLDWFNRLQSKSYLLSKIFKDGELNDFVHMALIDYMAIRKFEFGKFFLNGLSKSIIDTTGYFFDSKSEKVKKFLENNPNKLELIANKILNANSILNNKEALILVFAFNEYFSKSNNSDVVYAITNYIVRDNIYELNLKKNIFRNTISEALNNGWNLNKGRGGHKR